VHSLYLPHTPWRESNLSEMKHEMKTIAQDIPPLGYAGGTRISFKNSNCPLNNNCTPLAVVSRAR
jgi:hypothetical protein